MLLSFVAFLLFGEFSVDSANNLLYEHNVTFYAASYVSMSHNYLSEVTDTKKEANDEYPFFLNAFCDLVFGYPTSIHPPQMVLYEMNFTHKITLNAGKNEVNDYQLNTELMYDQSGSKEFNFFWFGQLALSVHSSYDPIHGANATLYCTNLTICNHKQNRTCIDDIQD